MVYCVIDEGIIKRAVAKFKAYRTKKRLKSDLENKRMAKAEAAYAAERGVKTQVPQNPDQQKQMDSEGAIRW